MEIVLNNGETRVLNLPESMAREIIKQHITLGAAGVIDSSGGVSICMDDVFSLQAVFNVQPAAGDNSTKPAGEMRIRPDRPAYVQTADKPAAQVAGSDKNEKMRAAFYSMRVMDSGSKIAPKLNVRPMPHIDTLLEERPKDNEPSQPLEAARRPPRSRRWEDDGREKNVLSMVDCDELEKAMLGDDYEPKGDMQHMHIDCKCGKEARFDKFIHTGNRYIKCLDCGCRCYFDATVNELHEDGRPVIYATNRYVVNVKSPEIQEQREPTENEA